MVRAFPIPPPVWPTTTASRVTNRLDSRATAGIFTRVPTKPTNHSKFTSRCGRRARCTGCHDSPTCKAKDKAKGTRKSRASDLTVNHRLVAWTVGNRGRGFDFFGSSATAMLDRLGEEEPELGLGEGELGFVGGGGVVCGDDDDEDAMSFCDVGFVMEDEIDGEWCVVGEL
ncbi:hypothetical protein Syun_005948 [Stephania yunnanensis]|uniref:Uncharacterized protein n=1 Tax=Stephania yunnanensis TaxID=152371 RepID=A0AAP0PX36_9MAGN